MKYTEFQVENFKGVNQLKLTLSNIPVLNIFTLVGLNESGKTTILEAINYFQNSDNDPNKIIPKNKRANFNGSIIIKASLETNAEDERKIQEYLKEKEFVLEGEIKHFTITKEYIFIKSNYQDKKSSWVISIPVKGLKSRSKKSQGLIDVNRDVWNETIKFIETSLVPKIVYYPNFLFDFPTAIYLESFPGEGAEQEFYRNVLQDVLDTLKQDLNLKDHLIDRKRSGTKNDAENIEKVLNEMSGKITKVVFDAWAQITKKKISGLQVTLGNDIKVEGQPATPENPTPPGRLYVEIKIKQGTDSYYISERSLGFRWFFAFLLFTQFRKYRIKDVGKILFLLDEPASNLHQTGQQVLLSSLEQLTDGSMVIYSTHSHHLINPKWLAGAFIVMNKGLNPDDKALSDDFNATKTDISVDRYYTFVAKYPNEETHFKPILEVLDYKPSELENVPDIVVPEGKFDYYTFGYFQDVILKLPKNEKIRMTPGAGKDKQDTIIALYVAWGRRFIVLLDSDLGGKEAKKRYLSDFGKIIEDKVFTLADIVATFDNFTTENLISEQERLDFTKTVFPAVTKYKKSEFNSAIQENYINNVSFAFSNQTKKNVKKVIAFLKDKLV